MKKKKVSAAQRRHLDYLRRKGLAAGAVYRARLVALRRAEVKRVLGVCAQTDDPTAWGAIIDNTLDESGYLYDWYTGLYLAAGLPHAGSTVRDLSRGKAEAPGGVWETALRDFAKNRAGRDIVTVSGTLKDDLKKILATALEEDINIGIEALTKRINKDFAAVNEWQARRIARTETMISLSEAGAIAAEDTGVRFVKTWAISGVGNTRESHEVMDGVRVEQNEYFQLPDGTLMLYPRDMSMNAPAGEIINCACSVYRDPI